MKITRAIVAIGIATVLIAGVWLFIQMRGRNSDAATIDVTETNVISADQLSETSRIVRVAGFDVVLNPVPEQITVLASPQTQTAAATQLPAPTSDPNVLSPAATATPIPVPTALPTSQTVVVNPTIAPNVSNRNNIAFVQHTVQQGETLYAIATRYGTSVSLMAEYSIAQDHIFAGNVINVPVAAANACVAGQRSHIVLEGDNVFRLAIRYSTTKEAIRAANPVINENYLIYAGDVICIP